MSQHSEQSPYFSKAIIIDHLPLTRRGLATVQIPTVQLHTTVPTTRIVYLSAPAHDNILLILSTWNG